MEEIEEDRMKGDQIRFVPVQMHDASARKIAVDEDGFIQDSSEWCQEFAEAVAPEESISELTDAHWKVINYLRNYFLKFGSCPPIKMLCKSVGLEVKQIYELFPTGPAKGACRLAGAPKPTGCV